MNNFSSFSNPDAHNNKGNKKEKDTQNIFVSSLKGIFSIIGKSLATVFFVGAITASICIFVLSILVLSLMNVEENIVLDKGALSYTTQILAETTPGSDEWVETQTIFGGENREYAEWEEIPQILSNAFVAIEDKRFYDHAGVDWIRTSAATIEYVIPSGSIKGGGSTITQQLIKNITRNDDVTAKRKIEEIFTALDLEKKYSKEDILTAYLNTIHLGNNTNGVKAAAKLYFGKDLIDLNLEECVAIAALPQSPAAYDPFRKPAENKERRAWVLEEMYKQNLITLEEKQATQKKDIQTVYKDIEIGDNRINSYYVDYLLNQIRDDFVTLEGYTVKQANDSIATGGLKIYSGVDLEAQSILEQSLLDYDNTFSTIKNIEEVEAGMSIITTYGKLVAIAGSTAPKTLNRSFSYASDALRQPSSTMKPFVYAQGIENNLLNYSTIFSDSPHSKTESGADWPGNYYGRYDGNMTVAEALRRSVNTVAVKSAEKVGPENIFNFLESSLGITSLVRSEEINGKVFSDIGLAQLGIGAWTRGVSTLEWAAAYQIFANGGYYTKPYSYYKVEDHNGNVILEPDTTAIPVIGADTASVMNSMLQEVVSGNRGTGPRAKIEGTLVGGKTGTSNEDYDQWFAGFTPDYVAVIWMGYETIQQVKYTGEYPPPIVWGNIMKKIQPLAQNPKEGFPVTDKVIQKTYCTISGNLAVTGCPSATGIYKTSNVPPSCTSHVSFEFNADEYNLPEGAILLGDGIVLLVDGTTASLNSFLKPIIQYVLPAGATLLDDNTVRLEDGTIVDGEQFKVEVPRGNNAGSETSPDSEFPPSDGGNPPSSSSTEYGYGPDDD